MAAGARLKFRSARGASHVRSAGSARRDDQPGRGRGDGRARHRPQRGVPEAAHGRGRPSAADVVITMGCGDACPDLTRASGTRTGSSRIPQERTSRPSAASATRSTRMSAVLSASFSASRLFNYSSDSLTHGERDGEGGVVRRVGVGRAGARQRPAGRDRRRARAGRALGRRARRARSRRASPTPRSICRCWRGPGSCARAARAHGSSTGWRATGSPSCGRPCATSRCATSPRCRCSPTSIWASGTASSSFRPRSSRSGSSAATSSCSTCGPEPEYRAGHIAGARSAPLPALDELAGELPKRREIVAYCRGPYCVYADDAVRLLRARGLKARRLDVGYPEWRRAGLPVEIAS